MQVAVGGVPDARGHVHVDLCTKETFLKKSCALTGSAPAQPGTVWVTISNVPPGEYAAQAFDDPTDSGTVHQNLLGIPREAVGFSNDPPIGLKGPSFARAAFTVGEETKQVSLHLHHVLRRPK